MIAEERWSHIVDLIEEQGVVSVPQLMEALDASESTIRRDLLKLDALGRLTKVHGGATKNHPGGPKYVMSDQPLEGRRAPHSREKRAIGTHAASLIGADDFVFVDGGTTTACLIDAIGPTTATFLTNSLPHAQRLLAKGIRTLLPGGELKQSTEVLVGAETVNHIRRYHFTIGFWGANGASPESGFTTPEFDEAAVKEISLEQTARPFVLCESSKFSRISLITFADFDAATVICERTPEQLRGATNVHGVWDAQRRSQGG